MYTHIYSSTDTYTCTYIQGHIHVHILITMYMTIYLVHKYIYYMYMFIPFSDQLFTNGRSLNEILISLKLPQQLMWLSLKSSQSLP